MRDAASRRSRAPRSTSGTDGRGRVVSSAPLLHSRVTAASVCGEPWMRRALHVVQHAAHAAHLLAAAGAPRPAVHEVRQRRAVARGLLRAVAVHEHQSGRDTPRCPAPPSRATSSSRGEQRADEAAPPQLARARSPRRPMPYGMIVFTGPNASTSCGSRALERLVAVQQHRGIERALLRDRRRRRRSRPGRRTPAPTPRASCSTLSPTSRTCALAGEGPHAHALDRRIADLHAGEPLRQRARRRRRPCPSGTKVRRIAVHFCPAFTVISARLP